jgi:hypothetical protein
MLVNFLLCKYIFIIINYIGQIKIFRNSFIPTYIYIYYIRTILFPTRILYFVLYVPNQRNRDIIYCIGVKRIYTLYRYLSMILYLYLTFINIKKFCKLFFV